MNAWLYARLSLDDATDMDSLANQMEICKEFALGQGFFERKYFGFLGCYHNVIFLFHC